MNNIPTARELTALYIDEKLSLSEMSSKTNIKTHKIRYWMDKYGIKRRQRSDANYIKANPYGEPYKIKTKLTRQEVKLKYLALGLYWGEGSKTTIHGVKVTNSDPGVIKQFQKYLHKVCQVRDDKIRFYLQTFKDNNIDKAKNYWAKQMLIDPSRINTCNPIKSMGDGTYKKISSNGVMTIAFYNIHLRSYIMNELGKLGLIR